jgi:Ser/Thr protein kinase RdoA (MazF antagonist)
VTQEFIRRDKLDFSEWAWANKAKVLLETLADEVAEVLTENLAECLGARLRYDKELDDLFVHADLQADNINYEDGVEVRSRLVEEVDLTISNICVSSIGPW